MSEFVTLLGAEEVSKAGSSMRSSAATMLQAASQIEDSLYGHRIFLDEWIFRFEEAVEKLRKEKTDV